MSPSHIERGPGRERVGFVLKMFPRLSETFILNEVLELEAQGLGLEIFSLRQPADAVRHAHTSSVRSPITYLPQKVWPAPLRIGAAQLHVWRRHPVTWRHTLRNVLRRARADGDSAMLVPFFQACCIIREGAGLRHFHAHYANVPAKVALLIHRLTGAAYSVTTHAKDIFQNDPLASPKLVDRLSRARFLVANSRFSAEYLGRRLGRPDGIYTIYNGLDLDAFPFRTGRAAEPLVLGVGRLVEKKGFASLLNACRILKDRGVMFRCELIGTGPLSTALKEQIRSLGLTERARLCGPLPQHELREHYLRARVFALPCVAAANGDRDVLPNVLKEAMAMGVPVVTTRLEGIDELISDGANGLLVAPGDTTGLARQLEVILGQEDLGDRLARAARKTIEERFDRRTTVARLKGLLDEALRPEQIGGQPPYVGGYNHINLETKTTQPVRIGAYENCLR